MTDTAVLNKDTVWVEIPDFEYCDVCGQAVRPKGKGSHRRKHEGQVVSYCLIHPNATGVNIDLYLAGYTVSHPISPIKPLIKEVKTST